MKKLIFIAVAILSLSCSNDEPQTQTDNTTPIVENKIYTNMVFIEATYERLNTNGNQLQVSPGDAVTIFEKTTSIKITPTTFETNLIAPTAYFKNGSTYSFAPQTQFIIYENPRIIEKKIEYSTSYGKDKRSERYSY